MKRLAALMSLSLVAGCLTATPPEVAYWPVAFSVDSPARVAETPAFGVVRLSQVIVRSPYGERELAVLREDGTLAYDFYNAYAALPALMFKGVVFDALERSGLFKAVVGPTSSVVTPLQAEVTFTRLYLDCRRAGGRRMTAAVAVRLLKAGEIVHLAKGEGTADAVDGRYGDAVSSAVSAALTDALKNVPR